MTVLPELQSALRRGVETGAFDDEPRPEPITRAPRSRAKRGLATVVAVASVAAVAFATGLVGAPATPLSPSQAVASTLEDLETGVLHWRAVDASGEAVELWIDLDSGAYSREEIAPRAGASLPWVQWVGSDGLRWEQRPQQPAPNAPIVITDLTPREAGSGAVALDTPTDQIRDAMRAVSRGQATASSTKIGGTEAVRVDQSTPGRRTTVWISRDNPAQILRSRTTSWSCDAGERCDTPSTDATTTDLTTSTWDIVAGSDALANVAPPTILTGRYELKRDANVDHITEVLKHPAFTEE